MLQGLRSQLALQIGNHQNRRRRHAGLRRVLEEC
jgi:hypothetical protein